MDRPSGRQGTVVPSYFAVLDAEEGPDNGNRGRPPPGNPDLARAASASPSPQRTRSTTAMRLQGSGALRAGARRSDSTPARTASAGKPQDRPPGPRGYDEHALDLGIAQLLSVLPDIDLTLAQSALLDHDMDLDAALDALTRAAPTPSATEVFVADEDIREDDGTSTMSYDEERSATESEDSDFERELGAMMAEASALEFLVDVFPQVPRSRLQELCARFPELDGPELFDWIVAMQDYAQHTGLPNDVLDVIDAGLCDYQCRSRKGGEAGCLLHGTDSALRKLKKKGRRGVRTPIGASLGTKLEAAAIGLQPESAMASRERFGSPSRPRVSGAEPWKEYRLKALDMHNRSVELFRRASDASARRNLTGQGSAQYYASLGREAREQMERFNRLAAETLVARSDGNQLDLHGLFIKEALEAVDDALNAFYFGWSYGQARDTRRQFRIITGRGLHSSSNRSKLHPAICNHLKRNGWRFQARVGDVVVFGPSS
ncbi:hypothetical protein DFJ74DRAFT_676418 [Hyaloraphidium curvatum]|nr:hypothetical protein DFJ74DRAFT_676418 [Hyaloraphidium curvatum]